MKSGELLGGQWEFVFAVSGCNVCRAFWAVAGCSFSVEVVGGNVCAVALQWRDVLRLDVDDAVLFL